MQKGPEAPEQAPEGPSFISPKEGDPNGKRGLRLHEDGAFDGVTLFAPLNSQMVYLIDMQGEILHRWATDSAPGAWVYLLANGELLRCGREDKNPSFNGGGIGGRIQKLAHDGSLIWNWNLASENNHQHHDVEPMPNGNILVISWERISKADAIARGRAPEHVGPKGFWPDTIMEIQPVLPDGAEVVWEWHAWDHIIQDTDASLPGYGDVLQNPGLIDINADHRDKPPLSLKQIAEQEALEEEMRALGYLGDDDEDEQRPKPGDPKPDWLHTNSISYHPTLDLILLSSPELNEIFVIDHSTTSREAASRDGGQFGRGGDLLWRWGNPGNYGLGARSDRKLFYQHDATWLSDSESGEQRILVYNNGGGRKDGDYSSVDELVLPFDSKRGFTREPGKAFGPEQPAWSYKDPEGFYSAFISGAQRLPGGNTLICSGAAGRLFEVTPEGKVVWDYYNPHGGEIDPPQHAGKAPPLALFRGTRLAREHPGVRALLKE